MSDMSIPSISFRTVGGNPVSIHVLGNLNDVVTLNSSQSGVSPVTVTLTTSPRVSPNGYYAEVQMQTNAVTTDTPVTFTATCTGWINSQTCTVVLQAP